MTDPNGPKDTPEQPAEAAEPVAAAGEGTAEQAP